ncbi:MAG: hypothetical protein P8K79_06555 [Mariniblastus sp.]|nr:hypothetical protein [Mariniblastus sp.]
MPYPRPQRPLHLGLPQAQPAMAQLAKAQFPMAEPRQLPLLQAFPQQEPLLWPERKPAKQVPPLLQRLPNKRHLPLELQALESQALVSQALVSQPPEQKFIVTGLQRRVANSPAQTLPIGSSQDCPVEQSSQAAESHCPLSQFVSHALLRRGPNKSSQHLPSSESHALSHALLPFASQLTGVSQLFSESQLLLLQSESQAVSQASAQPLSQAASQAFDLVINFPKIPFPL